MTDHHDTLHITGGTALKGEIHVNSAKNSALNLILASLLTDEEVILRDIPRLSDVAVALEMLEHFGAQVDRQGKDIHIQATEVFNCAAPYELVSKMRASFVAMGALLGRCGEARISMPGGCAFGPRPVDRHIKAFRQLGVELDEDAGEFHARRVRPLSGRIAFEAPTVGGTQNVMLASVLGSGSVTIENAALEPEVADLANMLNQMGAKVRGAGTRTIEIEGVTRLHGVSYRPIPDRIEAGTLMLAAAATRGTVTLRDVGPGHLRAVIAKLVEAGVKVFELGDDSLLVDAGGELRPVDVVAVEYPGFPTDLQAPFGAFLATIPGTSTVSDRIYLDRFTHVDEMRHMGARLELDEHTLTVTGSSLTGAQIHAADIRAGGALIVAALAARGESVLSGVQYIERGYEDMAPRLNALGAQIRMVRAGALATGTYGD